MRIIIVGGGKPLYHLSRKFLEKGHQVIIVNRNLEECREIARQLKVTVIHGDASDPEILEQAESRRADALLSITRNDQDNLAVCQTAKVMYDVPNTIALVNDPDNETVFRQLGVNAFSTTEFIAGMLEQRTGLDEITNLIPVGGGKVNITEIRLSDDSPVAGKALSEISFPKEQFLVAVVLRGDQALVPGGSTVLQPEDRIVIVSLPEHHGKVLKAISGKNL